MNIIIQHLDFSESKNNFFLLLFFFAVMVVSGIFLFFFSGTKRHRLLFNVIIGFKMEIVERTTKFVRKICHYCFVLLGGCWNFPEEFIIIYHFIGISFELSRKCLNLFLDENRILLLLLSNLLRLNPKQRGCEILNMTQPILWALVR